MGKQDAEVKVRMNTKQAQADLKGLNKVAAGTARQVGGRIRGGMGRVAGAIGLGAVGGAAVGAVKGSVFGAAGDVFEGATGGALSQLEEALFGDANLEALAAKQARASLPRRLLGSQTTEEGQKRVKAAALPGHLFRMGQDLKTLQGTRRFAQDPDFGGPGAAAIDTAIKTAKVAKKMGAESVLRAIAIWGVGEIVRAIKGTDKKKAAAGGKK